MHAPIHVGCVLADKAGFARSCFSVPVATLVNVSGNGDSEPEIFF